MIHTIEKDDDGKRHCTQCGREWKHPESRIQSLCSSVPFYTKENRPQGLLTMHELELRGLEPRNPNQYSAVLDHRQSLNGWKKLYKLEEAVPHKQQARAATKIDLGGEDAGDNTTSSC